MELSFAEYADKNRVKNTKTELHLAVVVIGVMLFTFNVGSYLAEISMDTERSSVLHENLIALRIYTFLFSRTSRKEDDTVDGAVERTHVEGT